MRFEVLGLSSYVAKPNNLFTIFDESHFFLFLQKVYGLLISLTLWLAGQTLMSRAELVVAIF